MIPIWLQAGFWGLVAGTALVIGAGIAYFTNVSARIIASIMAFGSGVLISTLSFNLMDEAYKRGGLTSTAIGFVVGAGIYTIFNVILSKKGAKHRKRSGNKQPSESESSGSGVAIAIGSILDDIPESVVIGLSMLQGGSISYITVIAIFLSNIPEGLSSAAGMKKAGRSALYIFGIWIGIAIITGISALIGYSIFGNFSKGIISASTALAAGGILAMIADTMIPEAFEKTHDYAGLITVIGFLVAFYLTKYT